MKTPEQVENMVIEVETETQVTCRIEQKQVPTRTETRIYQVGVRMPHRGRTPATVGGRCGVNVG